MAKGRRRPTLEIDGTRLTLAQLRAFEARRPRVLLAADRAAPHAGVA